MSLKSFIRRNRPLHGGIKALMSVALDPLCRLRGRPRARMPWRLRAGYTMNGQVQVLYAYVDAAQSQPLHYSRETIEAIIRRVAAEELGHYGGMDAWLYAALKKHPVRGQRVAIMGSADQGYGPWYECICLHFQGQPITIDYNPIEFADPRLQFVKAPVDPASLPPFDAAFSISSFEHDGLGRYGDPLDPDADLKAMRYMKKWVKPGGLMYLTVPVGRDKVVFNIGRIYGRARLPLLLKEWTVVESFGFEDAVLDRDTGFGWNPTVFARGANGWEEKLMHPDYPEYGPVWVLRNDPV